MVKRLLLYWNTLRYMKLSQIYSRVKKAFGFSCTLGTLPAAKPSQTKVVATVDELDFDTEFLSRFSADELIDGKVSFLHQQESFDWRSKWSFDNHSALWNFNLHYFEFLFKLVYAYRESKDEKYLNQIKECILGWIDANPLSDGGAGWSPYTIALRTVNWLECFFLLEQLREDTEFSNRLTDSIYEQYCYLSRHLEKDLLANHYFDDLKALLFCALFFGDGRMLEATLKEFKLQCREQILSDGMHFELSPMYHKIILEDVIRVAVALRGADRQDAEIEAYIKLMTDVAYSFEEGLERLPLFNDGGSNVAKSLDSLLYAVKSRFKIEPEFKSTLTDSGYYIFNDSDFRLIVDAGKPGPEYIPGHAHCDAMSFELFKAGKPVLVNCGTYAYQCSERSFFRSTAAHNTVMVNGTEQSQCWGDFRTAKRSATKVLSVDSNSINMQMTDQNGNSVNRQIRLCDGRLDICDTACGKQLSSFVHVRANVESVNSNCYKEGLFGLELSVSGDAELVRQPYSEEYGLKEEIGVIKTHAADKIEITVK